MSDLRSLTAALAGFVFLASPASPASAASAESAESADIDAAWRDLLALAAERQDDEGFRETAEMVFSLSEVGTADIAALVAEIAPERADVLADWAEEAEGGAAATGDVVAIVADPPPPPRIITPPQIASSEPADAAAWFAAPIVNTLGEVFGESLAWAEPDEWDGRLRAGVQLARGNTDLSSYAFALELNRDFSHGWSMTSRAEWLDTETDGAKTQDRWSASARLERDVVDGYGYYAAANFVSDALGSYRTSAFLTGGGLWTPFDRDDLSWTLRAGAGARYREARITTLDSGEMSGGETEAGAVAEAGSVFQAAIGGDSEFRSETTLYADGDSRLDQRFALSTEIVEHWAVETGLNIEHEFSPTDGSEATDTRLNLSIVRAF